MFMGSSEFNSFLRDPSIPKEKKIAGLEDILKSMGATDLMKNFIGKAICAQGLNHNWC